jgi:hypothetical protein
MIAVPMEMYCRNDLKDTEFLPKPDYIAHLYNIVKIYAGYSHHLNSGDLP